MRSGPTTTLLGTHGDERARGHTFPSWCAAIGDGLTMISPKL
ncbi:hypothetical protein [Candidatus Poriferisodalis sp.]